MFDLIIVLLAAGSIFLGFRFGLFRRLVHFGGFFVALLLATNISPGVSTFLGYNTSAHAADAHFGIFLAIVVALVVIVEILGAAFGDALGFLNALVFDRFLGAIAGAVVVALELSVLLYLFQNLMITTLPGGAGHTPVVTSSADQLDQSILARGLRAVRPAATFVYLPALPTEPTTYFSKTYI